MLTKVLYRRISRDAQTQTAEMNSCTSGTQAATLQMTLSADSPPAAVTRLANAIVERRPEYIQLSSGDPHSHHLTARTHSLSHILKLNSNHFALTSSKIWT